MNKKIKSMAKNILPLGAVRLWKKLRTPLLLKGKYTSWDEARENSLGYSNANIFEKVKSAALQVKNGKALYERDSLLFCSPSYSNTITSSLIRASLLNRNGPLTILDFGGSLGSTYFQHKNFLKNNNHITWTVIEQDHFVDFGSQHLTDSILNFTKALPQPNSMKPDLLLFSSVLQYLENYAEIIANAIALAPNIITVARTPFHRKNDPSSISVQIVPKEIYSASYPIWLFNQESFLRIFQEHYNLVDQFTNDDFLRDDIEFKSFVFEKKS